MMQFEDLGELFSLTDSIVLSCVNTTSPKSLTGKYVQLNFLGNDKIYLRVLGNDCVNTGGLNYECKLSSDKQTLSLDRARASTRQFFKVTNCRGNKIYISALEIERYERLDKSLEICISDDALTANGLTFDQLEKQIRQDFEFEILDTKYFVRARYIDSQSQQFALVNSSHLIDIVKKLRGDFGNCNAEMEDDDIFAVLGKSKSYDTSNYEYTLVEESREHSLLFKDYSSVSATRKRNDIYLAGKTEKYVKNWKKYIEYEEEDVSRQQKLAGELNYSSYYDQQDERIFHLDNPPEEIEKFIKQLEKLNGPDNAMEDLSVGKCKLKFKRYDRRNNKFICQLNQGYAPRLKRMGIIQLSTVGFDIQNKRRKEAIERVQNGQDGMHNVASLLSGENPCIRKREIVTQLPLEELRVIFGGHYPTLKQKEAILMALNTPDIAIIQGPPGTGKTRVITAIHHMLSKRNKCASYVDGSKICLTAYQISATENLQQSIAENGLPIPKYVGASRQRKEIFDDAFRDWIDGKIEELEKENPDINEKVEEKYNQSRFYLLKDKYKENIENFTYENDIVELNNILKSTKLNIIEPFEQRIQEYINIAQAQLNNNTAEDTCALQYNCVKHIPTSAISYEDDGAKLVKKALYVIRKYSGKGEQCRYIDDLVSRLDSLFSEKDIDFDAVIKVKNKLLVAFLPSSSLIPPMKFNKEIYALLEEIADSIQEINNTEADKILFDYIQTFKQDPVQIKGAIDKFTDVISATHQQVDNIQSRKENSSLFDAVIVDEAARSCPPDLLIPMSYAKECIILVGDHKQLPQLINDDIYKRFDESENISEEERADLKITMFERLIKEVEKLTKIDGINRYITLTDQYRTRKKLGDFVSKYFYESDKENPVKINSPLPDEIFAHSLPGIENKAMVWMDVKGDKDQQDGKSKKRPAESKAIANYIKEILNTPSCDDLTIGVISFYKGQVKDIKEQLEKLGICERDEDNYLVVSSLYSKRLVVDTVDAFQGLEKDVIILSMTRSSGNAKYGSFGFLRSMNRMCVAMSRQKKCLIIAGDSRAMSASNAKTDIGPLEAFYRECEAGGEEVGILRMEK